jgi:ribosome-associated heat shock protein Hsp15
VPRRGRQGSCRSAPQPCARADTGATDAPAQRLDKWLWFARLARTRTLAARLIEDGKVRVNREKVLKPAHNVRAGDVITAALGGRVRVARITDAGKRRGPAEEARGLYEDLTPPMEAMTPTQQSGQHGAKRAEGSGRPTKRERRKLDALRAQDIDEQP